MLSKKMEEALNAQVTHSGLLGLLTLQTLKVHTQNNTNTFLNLLHQPALKLDK